jgi:hypothetical protein
MDEERQKLNEEIRKAGKLHAFLPDFLSSIFFFRL